MSRDEQNFLRRWSRLKRQPAAKPDVSGAPSELPALEALTFESDFGAFMRAKVDEGVKRAALKKLFSDPRFNVMDGLDVYIDDYSKNEPIPPAMLAGLRQAQKIFEWAKEDEAERKNAEQQLAENPAPELPAAQCPEIGRAHV